MPTTRSAASAKRSASRPTTTTSTVRPAGMSPASNQPCCVRGTIPVSQWKGALAVSGKSVFRTPSRELSTPSDPESLFHALRERDREIRHLWSQQADVLRVYHRRHLKTKDLAIELPTGAGKTLVGLLIAEWRRRTYSERVAYLCPTRQLAKQVHKHAGTYGIRTSVLVGKQAAYPEAAFVEYASGQSIAVTTYAAIFNTNPRINDASLLILDDAHATESTIGGMWSVDLSRVDHPELYLALLELLRDAFDAGTARDLADADWEPRKGGILELVSGAFVRRHLGAIRDLLSERIPAQLPLRYAWDTIQPHLDACAVYVSWHAFLIRPLVPPTLVHHAFQRANQRLFMSATLGAGGELERVAGIPKIERIPLPAGWENHGTGRRLIVLPELSVSNSDAVEVAAIALQTAGRGLVLAPSQYDDERGKLLEALKDRGVPILSASDIEDDLDPFVQSDHAALVLTRYDGLDLPDDACRCVVLAGLPSGTNLQERFLWSKLAAHALLRDRVLTRFVQGAGRCTRSDNDYALVIVLGSQLRDFLLKSENQTLLNPELHAETKFGIANSREMDGAGFSRLCEAFFAQGDDWRSAEEALVDLRGTYSRHEDPVSGKLKATVGEEIAYQYAKWSGDLEKAFECARRTADALDGDGVKAYRAWWYYLSADAAAALLETTGDGAYRNAAADSLARASACCPGVRWFTRLGRLTDEESSDLNRADGSEMTAIAVEGIRRLLSKWGIVGGRFERRIADIEECLASTGHKVFHRGLRGLGEMLGFDTDLPKAEAAPDCVWSLGHSVYVVHEAKSEHTPKDPIGASDVRQAAGHAKWVRARYSCDAKAKLVCLIESPRQMVTEAAVPHATNLYHVAPEELAALLGNVAAVLRRVRARMTEDSEEALIDELLAELTRRDLAPSGVLERLTKRPVSAMPVSGRPQST